VKVAKMLRRIVCLSLVVGLLGACATHRMMRRASDAVKAENWDAAVYYYLEALADNPGDLTLKMELQRARLKAGEQHFRQGMRFKEVGALQRARSELELAVQLDPTHQYAEVELRKVRADLAVLAEEGGEAKLEALKKAAAEMKVKPPTLNPASHEPITLSFPNQTNVKDIYKAISQAFGFNIMFDPKLKDSKAAIELKDVSARQAMENVVQAAGHFYKVLDEKTVIVVEDTPQNRRDYEDLVVKTFFLSNADVKEVNNMLRALIDARRIAINEALNAIVIRDTADKVAIAERLINSNDKSKAEVVVDVELIQVDSTKLRDIGTSLSSYTYSFSLDSSGITGSSESSRIPLPNLGDITRSMWGVVVPNLTLSLTKSAGEAETLASPTLRITEGEKGNLVIGDKVPIPTTTFNTTQTVGGNIVPITSFQYQDVGIKIDIEPRVHHNNEITMKLQVEVSELGENVEVSPGQKQPKIGTRTINSVIRLKDGETSLLAGLFRYNKRSSRAGLPWVSDLPVVGGLFRSNSHELKKTDLILTLTPHIIRNPDITEEDLAPLWVGTENRITIFGNSPRVRSSSGDSPFGSESAGPGFEGDARTDQEEANQPAPAPEVVESDDRSSGGENRTITLPGGREITVPRRDRRTPGGRPGGGDSPDATDAPAASDDALAAADGLSALTFYPSRLPVRVGSEGELVVVLDAGYGGVTGPLYLAYDPARLEVTHVEGGSLAGADRALQVGVAHTPALGWITAGWSGQAVGSGTLLVMRVRPLASGELPVIFAGPVGAAVATPATVVAVPAAVAVRSPQGEDGP